MLDIPESNISDELLTAHASGITPPQPFAEEDPSETSEQSDQSESDSDIEDFSGVINKHMHTLIEGNTIPYVEPVSTPIYT
jgi:hypothetical protein